MEPNDYIVNICKKYFPQKTIAELCKLINNAILIEQARNTDLDRTVNLEELINIMHEINANNTNNINTGS